MNTTTRQQAVTQRQRQILRLIAAGSDDTAIAGELGIKPQTVRNTVQRALRRLGANNRAHAIHCCYTRGIFTTGEGG
jgi:DNA-binding NarL/FixJ family response regulator